MPETEPTPWELMRLLRSVDRKLDDVVTKDMFQAESKRVDEKFSEMARDLADERVAREKSVSAEKLQREQELAFERRAREQAVAAERAERERAMKVEAEARKSAWDDQKARQDKQANNLRWLAAAIILPITLFVIERFGGS